MTSPEITVVVPTLNEERTLEACLRSIGGRPEIEVVVSDGESVDGTVRIAEGLGAIVAVGESGRGPQLNRGAAVATAERLLFVHADCRLPARWYDEMMSALEDETTALACFRLHTEPAVGETGSVVSRVWLKTLDLRARGFRLPYGDQGFGVRRELFDRVGGFPDIPLMEDLEFARICKNLGGIKRLGLEMRTTARRTAGQPFRARAMWVAFPWLYRLGVSPETLAKWYGEIR